MKKPVEMDIASAEVVSWVPPCGRGVCEYECKYIIVKMAYSVC